MMKTNLNCVHLWNSIRVNNSGTCTSCCLQNLHYKDDFNQDLNIRKHTLEDIIKRETKVWLEQRKHLKMHLHRD